MNSSQLSRTHASPSFSPSASSPVTAAAASASGGSTHIHARPTTFNGQPPHIQRNLSGGGGSGITSGGHPLMTRGGESDRATRYDQQRHQGATAPAPPVPQRTIIRQDSSSNLNTSYPQTVLVTGAGSQPPPPPPQQQHQHPHALNIPSSVRAAVHAQHSPPPPQEFTYTRLFGQPQGHQSPQPELNYQYGPNPPFQAHIPPPPPPPQPTNSRQHQEYLQKLQQLQQQQQQRTQLPPTPPMNNLPFPPQIQPVQKLANHSSTSNRTNGYPSPIEQQLPRRASNGSDTHANAFTSQIQSHSYIQPQPPAPIHGKSSPAQPPPRSNPEPQRQYVAKPTTPIIPPPAASGSSTGSVAVNSSIVPAQPIPQQFIDPLILAATKAALDPIQRGLEALWGNTVMNVQQAMSKMHQDFTVIASRERQKNVELQGKIAELDAKLRTTTAELDGARRELVRVKGLYTDLEKKKGEVRKECEALTKQRDGLKAGLHHASTFIVAFKREYEKAKAHVVAGGQTLGGLPGTQEELKKTMNMLVEHGMDLDKAAATIDGPSDLISSVNKALTSLTTKMRDENDTDALVSYVATMLGAVGDEVSRKVDMKMNVILGEMELEKTKRIRAEAKLQEVEKNLHYALPFLERRRTSSRPQSRVASPEPMSAATTPSKPVAGEVVPAAPLLCLQRSVSSDSGMQQLKRLEDTNVGVSQPDPRSISVVAASPMSSSSSSSSSSALQALSSSHSLSSPSATPPQPSSSSSHCRPISTENSQQPLQQTVISAAVESLNSVDSPLPTPPPSRARDDSFVRDGDVEKGKDTEKDKNMMDWVPSDVSKQQQQRKEKPPTPVAFRSSPLNVKKTPSLSLSTLGTMSMSMSIPSSSSSSSRHPSVVSSSEAQPHGVQSPSPSPHLGKRDRSEYDQDDDSEHEGGRPVLRVKIDPELEEEEDRRTLSMSSSLNGSGAMNPPTGLPRRPGLLSSSSSTSVTSQGSSRSREEGELVQHEQVKKKRNGEEYEEGEVLERTPSVTATPTPASTPPPPTTAQRARVRIRPEVLSRLPTLPESKAQAQVSSQTLFQRQHHHSASQDRPQKPPSKLGIKHMDLLYLNENNSLTCRFCLTLRYSEMDLETRRKVSIKKFPGNASWDELISHSYTEHPTACKDMERLTPGQVEETKQRLLSNRRGLCGSR